MRPSCGKQVRPCERASAYRIASASVLGPNSNRSCASSQACKASMIGLERRDDPQAAGQATDGERQPRRHRVRRYGAAPLSRSARSWPAHLIELASRAPACCGTSGTDDAQLSRNPIQHLAHALSDDMQRAATAAADYALNIEADFFARQMAGRRLASRGPFVCLLFATRTLLFLAGKVAVALFERERSW
jgi:hypothetical protein